MAGLRWTRSETAGGGEAAFGGEWLVRRRFPDISRLRGSFFLDRGEQPRLNLTSPIRALRGT
jgi:hypothetical protein